ncbi:MAG: DUF2953 domain-containing protein [Methanomicrobiaceae archaeon]|nr:DUF2953 domain-containing protein [Methanomicrobiaceae archaeon]
MPTFTAILLLFMLAAAFLLLLALYLVPVEVIGTVERKERMRSWLSVSWGVLALRFVLDEEQSVDLYFGKRRLFHRFIDRPSRKGAPAVVKEEGASRVPLSQLVDAWPSLQRLFLRILRCITFRRLSCDLRFGLANPADTGILYGYLWALKGLLAPLPRVQLSMTPVFDRSMLECSGTAHFAVQRPLMVLVGVAAAFTRRPVRRLMTGGTSA